MTKDSEPGTVRPTASEAESTTAQMLDMHRARRMRSGQSWSDYWGEGPTKALARMPRVKHVGEMTDNERTKLYRKLAGQF